MRRSLRKFFRKLLHFAVKHFHIVICVLEDVSLKDVLRQGMVLPGRLFRFRIWVKKSLRNFKDRKVLRDRSIALWDFAMGRYAASNVCGEILGGRFAINGRYQLQPRSVAWQLPTFDLRFPHYDRLFS